MPKGIYTHKTTQGFQKGNTHYTSGEKTQFKKWQMKADSNVNWKGDKVGYHGLHKWVARQLGKPKHCAYCQNTTHKQSYYHWANISQSYKRELSDWIRLCAKCHSHYDHGLITLKING